MSEYLSMSSPRICTNNLDKNMIKKNAMTINKYFTTREWKGQSNVFDLKISFLLLIK
jgi:hypothetical protein